LTHTKNKIVDGWWQEARKIPSPNFSMRPQRVELELLVIHNISLPPGEFGGGFIEQFFLNKLNVSAHPWFENIRDVRVSSHCLIGRDGLASQFVSFNDKAWHAGESRWRERENCNTFSIGVELEGCDTIAYTDQQYHTLAQLTLDIMTSYPKIKPDHIVGHEHIAPTRKTDPGPAFDWSRYFSMLKR
jgi:N-acetyl-anhydromuramoyl-L-alanine amidase